LKKSQNKKSAQYFFIFQLALVLDQTKVTVLQFYSCLGRISKAAKISKEQAIKISMRSLTLFSLLIFAQLTTNNSGAKDFALIFSTGSKN